MIGAKLGQQQVHGAKQSKANCITVPIQRKSLPALTSHNPLLRTSRPAILRSFSATAECAFSRLACRSASVCR